LSFGSDLVGAVESVGEGAGRFSPGEELFGQLPLGLYGTYAEYLAVNENVPLAQLPKGLDRTVAAALPTPGVTALQIVESLGQLAGKTALIVGAGGGVGSLTTQLAAQAGVEGHRRRPPRYRRTSAQLRRRRDSRQRHRFSARHCSPGASRRNRRTGCALVRPRGTALSTRYVADTEALASRGVAAVNAYHFYTLPALRKTRSASDWLLDAWGCRVSATHHFVACFDCLRSAAASTG
jgi:hypothetical protein